MNCARVLLRIGLSVLLVAACSGCKPTCEQATAQKNHPLAAARCEQAFLKDKTPEHALATLRAFTLLNKHAEVKARLSWLKGTPYEGPITQHQSALAARAAGDDAATDAALTGCLAGALSTGLHDFAARCARLLASLQWTQGRFHDAFINLGIALAEVRQAQDPILEGMVYGQLADLLAEVGDEAGQGRALDAVADRFRPVSAGGYAQVRLRQGSLELKRGHPNVARDCFEEALTLSADAGLGTIGRAAYVNLAEVARSVGDFDAGQAALAAAAAIPALRSYEDTTLWFEQASQLGGLGRWREAQTILSGALDAGAIADWHWQLSTLQGESFEQLGEPEAARAAYEQAAAAIDSLRATALRPGLLAERRRPFEALFELHVQQGEPLAALAVMEQLLGATFLETMAAGHLPAVDLDTAARDAVRRLHAIDSVARYQKSQPALSPPQVLERLGKREVLAFLTARNHLYRVHLSAGKIDIQQLESPKTVSDRRQHLDAHPEDLEAAEALGRALWPSRPLGSEVLIVPDASFAALSFAGLRFNGRYLVEDHVLSYAPSLGLAATLLDRVPHGSGAIVLGDPSGDLPGAAAEAIATSQTLDAGLSLGPAATLKTLEAGCHASLLHLAAHSGIGVEGAWLQLADGKLTAAKVLADRCGPALVYLASCASAASARKDGAGTLASAFLAAGSRFVVATTGSIDDATAARFARIVFADGKWDQPKLRVARAQRALLKTAPRSAWEPFIVLGP
jgi:tetratricopeptide (TPR) repeat protein